MRSLYLVHGLLTGLLIVACGKTELSATEGASTDSDGGSDTEAATNTTSSSNSGGNACIPGMSVVCACPDGSEGAQVCAPDGKSFGACECIGSSGSASEATSSPTEPTTSNATNVTTDPTNPTSATTTDATTTTDGTTTDGTTTGGSTTGGSTTGAPVCNDPGFEPNEDENSAEDLGDQGCGDMDGSIVGVLDGDTDVDFSTFHGVDSQACGFQNPFIGLTLTASDAVRLCVYTDCDNGTPMFTCPMGSMGAMSPNGLPGCCGNGDMSFQFNCSNSQNESADVYVSVDQAPADACVDYTIAYSWGAQ